MGWGGDYLSSRLTFTKRLREDGRSNDVFLFTVNIYLTGPTNRPAMQISVPCSRVDEVLWSTCL
jgi:hypothetical protein